MCQDDYFQAKNVQIPKWLLHMQSEVEQLPLYSKWPVLPEFLRLFPDWGREKGKLAHRVSLSGFPWSSLLEKDLDLLWNSLYRAVGRGDGGREVLQEMLSCSLSHPAWGKEGCDGQRIWWKRFRNWKHGIFPGNSARENKNTKRRPDGPSYWSTIVQFRTWNFFLCLKLKVSNLRLHLKFNPIFHYYCYQSLVLLYIWSDSSSLRAN